MSQAATATLTLQIPVVLEERLEEVAQATDRSMSSLAREALRSFLDLYEWQTEAIRRGIEDADAGRLVEHESVATWLESWGSDPELPPP